MENQRPWVAKEIPKKNNKVEEHTLPDFKAYYNASVIKTVLFLQKGWHTNQWNRIENLEINLYIYSRLIFDKHVKKIQWENNIFNDGAGIIENLNAN